MQGNFQQQQQQLHSKILAKLEQSSSQPGVPGPPKEDKILEWTLFKIYQELQQLNQNISKMAHKP